MRKHKRGEISGLTFLFKLQTVDVVIETFWIEEVFKVNIKILLKQPQNLSTIL